MTGRTLANLLAVFVALTSAASIHAQTRDEARADGKDLTNMTLAEMDVYWDRAKASEKEG